MRFDAYSATFRDVEPEAIIGAVSGLLGGQPEDIRGMYGYRSGAGISLAGERLATVLWGGNPGVHVQVQGAESVQWSTFARATDPGHAVTRADVAEDLDGAGTWDRLFPQLSAIASDRGLVIDCQGDWVTPGSPKGRTFYVGAPTSAVRVRLYEKGKQLRNRAVEPVLDASLDWCRLEVQTRPKGPARDVAAAMPPEAFWGLADWSQEVARQLFALDVERIHVKEVRDLDTHRSIRAMVGQYGGVMVRRSSELGSDDAALRELVRLMQAEMRRKRQGGDQ